MKYTAGELRKMNGRKCKFQYEDRPEAEWEIYVIDWQVNFVSNEEYDGYWSKKEWYNYSYILIYKSSEDDFTAEYKITFLDEQKTSPEKHQNIYYDDNGEIIKEWDLVLVWTKKEKNIFLCKLSKEPKWTYICVSNSCIDSYNDWYWYNLSVRTSCIKYKEPERKLRELMLTDEEYEEVKNKYK